MPRSSSSARTSSVREARPAIALHSRFRVTASSSSPSSRASPSAANGATLLGRALVEDRVLDRARQSLEARDVATHERPGLRVAQCREPRLALDLLVERLDEHAREVGSLRHFDPFSCE